MFQCIAPVLITPSEAIFRKLVILVHNNKNEELTFLKALAKQNRLNTTITLKVN
jgi:hypothetical protein